MARRQSRLWFTGMAGLLVAGAIVYGFWPRPLPVDVGQVVRAPMQVTIAEDGKTRVRDAYMVSAPIDGQLLRVDAVPGDLVIGGKTVVARMRPAAPPVLDTRTLEQAHAAVDAAEAALAVAHADLHRAQAEKDFQAQDVARKRDLTERGITPRAALDEAERAWRAATANVDMAQATIAMREAERANARADLMSFGETGAPVAGGGIDPVMAAPDADSATTPITAPVSGRILRLVQESETTVAAGTPILEVGDIANDLEVVTELLSSDAVQVSVGDGVIIENWGGDRPLAGTVQRVEPWGFTKVSALGVEEQRVNVIIALTDPPENRPSLGHGFRVETHIVIWQAADAVTVPSSALIRRAERSTGGAGNRNNREPGWAAFRVSDGRAHLAPLTIGRNNGTQAEVRDGLSPGDTVILFPGPDLTDGAAVIPRD